MTTPVVMLVQALDGGTAIALSILVAALVARSARGFGRDENKYLIASALVLGAWFGVTTAVAAVGGFHAGTAGFLLLALSMVLPLSVGVTVGLTSAMVRRLISQSGIQPGVIALHALRIINGSVFLVLAAVGVLPAIFAVPAGAGDILAGLGAVLASRWISSGRSGRVLLWNLFGLLDLLNATVLGLVTVPGPLNVLQTTPTSALLLVQPLTIVPTFMVPAIYVLLHLVSVRYLAISRRVTRLAPAAKLEVSA